MQYIQSAMSGSMSATEAARAMAAYATGMQQVRFKAPWLPLSPRPTTAGAEI